MTDLERLAARVEAARDAWIAARIAATTVRYYAPYDAALDYARARYHTACVRYVKALEAQAKEKNDD